MNLFAFFFLVCFAHTSLASTVMPTTQPGGGGGPCNIKSVSSCGPLLGGATCSPNCQSIQNVQGCQSGSKCQSNKCTFSTLGTGINPTSPPDTTCSSDVQCSGDTPVCQTWISPRKCIPKVEDNQRCTFTSQCKNAGSTCIGSSISYCRPPLDIGESCSGSSAKCKAGGYCPEYSGRVCEAVKKAGENCSSNYQNPCESKYYCDKQKCVSEKADGSFCTQGTQCLSGFCSTSNKCVSYSVEGGACVRGSNKIEETCTSGSLLFCSVDNICTKYNTLAVGKNCTDNAQCASSFCTSGVCKKKFGSAVNSACTDHRECVTRYCGNGKCIQYGTAPLYAKCRDDPECESGWCSSYCREPLSVAEGESCTSNRACKPGLVCSGSKCLKSLARSCSSTSQCSMDHACECGAVQSGGAGYRCVPNSLRKEYVAYLQRNPCKSARRAYQEKCYGLNEKEQPADCNKLAVKASDCCNWCGNPFPPKLEGYSLDCVEGVRIPLNTTFCSDVVATKCGINKVTCAAASGVSRLVAMMSLTVLILVLFLAI